MQGDLSDAARPIGCCCPMRSASACPAGAPARKESPPRPMIAAVGLTRQRHDPLRQPLRQPFVAVDHRVAVTEIVHLAVSAAVFAVEQRARQLGRAIAQLRVAGAG